MPFPIKRQDPPKFLQERSISNKRDHSNTSQDHKSLKGERDKRLSSKHKVEDQTKLKKLDELDKEIKEWDEHHKSKQKQSTEAD